ncbi:hypothetical protein BJY52DRAFT_758083 [Lactarius psammicola]|nr:hypothetical protein BJY52DRAFT_758083 [Lactarius psammicola]
MPHITSLEANAQALHAETFLDNTHDVTLSHLGSGTSLRFQMCSTRHTTCPSRGTLSNLEFNKVTKPMLAQLYDQYSFSVILLLGTILTSDCLSYRYPIESIRRFSSQGDFA